MKIYMVVDGDYVYVSESSSSSRWWNEKTMEEKKQYIRDHPQSKYAKNKRLIKKNFRRTKAKVVSDIRSKVRNVHEGLGSLRTVLNPTVSASEVDKERAKKLLIGVAKVALVAGIVAGLTVGGVAPIARATADEFQGFLKSNYNASSPGFGEGTSSSKFDAVLGANGKQEDEELLKLYSLFIRYLKTKTKKELTDLVKGLEDTDKRYTV